MTYETLKIIAEQLESAKERAYEHKKICSQIIADLDREGRVYKEDGTHTDEYKQAQERYDKAFEKFSKLSTAEADFSFHDWR